MLEGGYKAWRGFVRQELEVANQLALALQVRDQARELVERAVGDFGDGDSVLAEVRAGMPPLAQQFLDGMRDQVYDGHLEASAAVRIAGLLHAAAAAFVFQDLVPGQEAVLSLLYAVAVLLAMRWYATRSLWSSR